MLHVQATPAVQVRGVNQGRNTLPRFFNVTARSPFRSICVAMSAEATAVTTGEQLLNAAGAGARDIEILGHLDLRGLKWHVRPSSSNFNEPQGGVKELLYSTGHLRSLRVRAFPTCVHAVAANLQCLSSRFVDIEVSWSCTPTSELLMRVAAQLQG